MGLFLTSVTELDWLDWSDLTELLVTVADARKLLAAGLGSNLWVKFENLEQNNVEYFKIKMTIFSAKSKNKQIFFFFKFSKLTHSSLWCIFPYFPFKHRQQNLQYDLVYLTLQTNIMRSETVLQH